MKYKYKLLCFCIAVVTLFALTCVPAMAATLSNAVADPIEGTDSPVASEVIITTDTAAVASEVYTDTSVYSEYESTDTQAYTDSYNVYTDSDIYTTDTVTDSYSEVPSDTDSIYDIFSDEDVHSSETTDEYQTYSSNYSYSGNVYNSIYTTSEDYTRSVITSETWSNISINEADGTTTGTVNNDNSGDFSFIKDNTSKNNSSLYYWLVGGIACLVIGLSGIAFIVVMTMEQRKKKALAAEAAKKRTAARRSASGMRASSKQNTAEFDLPDKYKDGY